MRLNGVFDCDYSEQISRRVVIHDLTLDCLHWAQATELVVLGAVRLRRWVPPSGSAWCTASMLSPGESAALDRSSPM